MPRATTKETVQTRKRIRALILSQMGGFTAYDITSRFLDKGSPEKKDSKKERDRIHSITRSMINVMAAEGLLKGPKIRPSNAPVDKKVYEVRR